MELTLMTDGEDSIKMKLSDITDPDNTLEKRTFINKYLIK